MKTKITTQEEEKKFTPFSVTFTAETIEDARLLFHITNHSDVSNLILDHPTYHAKYMNYSREVSKSIQPYISEDIRKTIMSMGFCI